MEHLAGTASTLDYIVSAFAIGIIIFQLTLDSLSPKKDGEE